MHTFIQPLMPSDFICMLHALLKVFLLLLFLFSPRETASHSGFLAGLGNVYKSY